MSETAEGRFRRLYRQHYAALLAYASRRLPDQSDAHDIVADTFLVLWRRLDVAPADDQIPLWLYGVARRVLANRFRSSVRRQRLAARLSEIPREYPETHDMAVSRLEANALFAAMLELTDSEREVLLLGAWERLSSAELATVLGCTENAAAIRLHRARKRLRELHEKESGAHGDVPSERLRLRQPPDSEAPR